MVEPDDFGLRPMQTLAHTGTTARRVTHGTFWQSWLRQASDHRAMLRPMRDGDDPSDPTATHAFESTRHVAVGCRLERPEHPRGGVVVLHGYSDPPTLAESIDRRRPLVERGLAVLAIRIRGYPGSRAQVGDLTAAETGWICHGLGVTDKGGTVDACRWVLCDAVADVLYAVAALRRALPDGSPVSLIGQSFGGGLATIAAAQSCASEGLHPEVAIERLVLGVPTFGDWDWRLERTHPASVGSGGELVRFLRAHPGDDEGIRRTLALFDATIHARLVHQPTICKLALRDDVVPAPTQAAVYNALGSAPGEKARFLTPFGHFDGGIADARRHALFDRFTTDFLDPSLEPAEAIALWEDTLVRGDRGPRGGS
ncbi:MAG: acetylxylan esterase [Planctomycetota bacterium]